jgi:hypothetical protein
MSLSNADIRFISRLKSALEAAEKKLTPSELIYFEAYLPDPLTLNFIVQRLREIEAKLPSVPVGPLGKKE